MTHDPSHSHESQPRPRETLAESPAGRSSWRPVHQTAAERGPGSPRGSSSVAGPWSWFIVFVLILLLLCFAVPYVVERVQYAMTRGKERAEREAASGRLEELSLVELSRACQLISKRVGPSVVHINVRALADDGPTDEYQWLYPYSQQEQGSGVIMDPEGYILTNLHVVRGATDIRVSLSDGRTVKATVVGSDYPTDLALLKIDANGLLAAEWGDSDEVEVGALVWAIGSPFGLEQSVTFGILSAKDRAGLGDNPYQDLLQTDAAINMGNSGGPLIDARGHVIGINTAIAGQTYQGVSFAIPSSVARHVYERLKARGRVERGWLGVQLKDVTPEVAERLGLERRQGALVIEVLTDSDEPTPAQKAKLLADDVVLRWDGKQVKDASHLVRLVASTDVGDEVEMVVWRDKREVTARVRVAARPDFGE